MPQPEIFLPRISISWCANVVSSSSSHGIHRGHTDLACTLERGRSPFEHIMDLLCPTQPDLLREAAGYRERLAGEYLCHRRQFWPARQDSCLLHTDASTGTRQAGSAPHTVGEIRRDAKTGSRDGLTQRHAASAAALGSASDPGASSDPLSSGQAAGPAARPHSGSAAPPGPSASTSAACRFLTLEPPISGLPHDGPSPSSSMHQHPDANTSNGGPTQGASAAGSAALQPPELGLPPDADEKLKQQMGAVFREAQACAWLDKLWDLYANTVGSSLSVARTVHALAVQVCVPPPPPPPGAGCACAQALGTYINLSSLFIMYGRFAS